MLKFDYIKTMAQVRELRAIADEMDRNRKLQEAIDKVKAGWEGQTSVEFQKKCNELVTLIKNEVASIRLIADNLQASAIKIAAAEKEAQDIINTNTIRKV